MSIQGVWNTQVTKQSSLWVSTGWVQLTALLVCVAAWFFTGRDPVGATVAGREQIYPAWRNPWGIYHRDRDPEYGKTRVRHRQRC